MAAANDVWTEALSTWQGMIPPLMNPAVVDPMEALRIGAGIQRAALDTWRDSCQQAHELSVKAVEWNLAQAGRAAAAMQERAR